MKTSAEDVSRGSLAKLAMRTFAIGLVGATALFALSGCTSDEIKWTEEVKLHDGRVIQVKRRTELTESGFPVQRRGFHKYHELCYEPMGIHWKSKPEYPLYVFDIIDGKAYIKVPVTGCAECMLQGYPAWDAAYFEWNDGSWKKVDETPALRALRFNLLNRSHLMDDGQADARGLITLAEKNRRDGSIYDSMRATGRTGPGVGIGQCQKCKAVRVQTDRTSEVLLTSDRGSCKW